MLDIEMTVQEWTWDAPFYRRNTWFTQSLKYAIIGQSKCHIYDQQKLRLETDHFQFSSHLYIPESTMGPSYHVLYKICGRMVGSLVLEASVKVEFSKKSILQEKIKEKSVERAAKIFNTVQKALIEVVEAYHHAPDYESPQWDEFHVKGIQQLNKNAIGMPVGKPSLKGPRLMSSQVSLVPVLNSRKAVVDTLPKGCHLEDMKPELGRKPIGPRKQRQLPTVPRTSPKNTRPLPQPILNKENHALNQTIPNHSNQVHSIMEKVNHHGSNPYDGEGQGKQIRENHRKGQGKRNSERVDKIQDTRVTEKVGENQATRATEKREGKWVTETSNQHTEKHNPSKRTKKPLPEWIEKEVQPKGPPISTTHMPGGWTSRPYRSPIPPWGFLVLALFHIPGVYGLLMRVGKTLISQLLHMAT